MTLKSWHANEIRALARQTIDGRRVMTTARGAYLRALIETTQSELVTGKSDQAAQLAALKQVHWRFYEYVMDEVTTKDIAHKDSLPSGERHRRALERNRRTNFARSAYATIKRWLLAPGHDLAALNAAKVTKTQLLAEAPAPRRHKLTAARIQARSRKLIGELVSFAELVAKESPGKAADMLNDALARLSKLAGDRGRARRRTPIINFTP